MDSDITFIVCVVFAASDIESLYPPVADLPVWSLILIFPLALLDGARVIYLFNRKARAIEDGSSDLAGLGREQLGR